MQIAAHFLQGKTMAGSQRQDDCVFRGGRLKFEVELAAETLAQRQTPGAVDAIAVRRMDDQLRSPAFVEETLEHQLVLRGQKTECSFGAGKVIDQLRRGIRDDLQFFDKIVKRGPGIRQTRIDIGTQPGYRK